MAFNYDDYLRVDKMPTQWCWGCGDGVVLKCIIKAIAKMGWNMDDVCVVSGIGCSGRMSSYVNCNTVHTTHGRALAYATGIKLANPTKHVIVVTGDGDTTAIGGNHLIHAARRNIDLTHIMINNFIYGLTNSQTSPMTPQGFYTVTAQFGNIDPTFDACELVKAAGASFIARGNVIDAAKLENMIYKAMAHEGYSFIDCFSNCHINLGRKNKMGEAVQMLDWISNRSVEKSKFDKLSDEEKVDKFPVGILYENKTKPEYCKAYEEVRRAAKEGRMVNLNALGGAK
ncbi:MULTISPECIES: 2-oxoglutarate ferredoxin oxidoreductase subunit beta [unclassified Campylobacter]|uniref:2-oxoglutarate ferredoxin oxidoreductase subunit beta n=1 Tax=unclassified Campylobacter TaxID=2593542 RepID=UPI001BD97DD6|nr:MULTISPECIES: 2-oxoglutarate ferredoxin oxidoreductase subunit beta [unclassified Campylobacter]MBZ7976844.1 2-oxoglutarate ferredoxin oxidoreductase subunit beta [Campylobacter sp. RM12637]MBZ7978592.1 2-oxoglutarate ferredoxin oxidoreductase subunit beta [Campylobacter sp. RM12654]MBZ7980289.1 2-oxoglutarate ferredoxin oxidoreductase subunit beta [Campylobacter sp. RM12642]MBZ7982426.1 2-oxoglutarate ferredoxin oxidoreductase subunit beta [Campylobacter sp. RM12640]MBZ7989608.1 2-oxogluta